MRLTFFQALATLHEEIAIIHGDIKPSNALWDGTELAVKLIDFGNAVDGPIHEGGMYFLNVCAKAKAIRCWWH